MPELIALHYSPWSERARWSLDHHKIAYDYSEYVPLLGEVWLRMKLKNFTSKASVPALIIDENTALTESWDIASYADQHGRGSKLLAKPGEIRGIIDKVEIALQAGRIRTTSRIRDNEKALKENMPDFIPDMLQGASIPVAWLGSAYLLFKYDVSEDNDQLLSRMRNVLIELDKKVQAAGEYLLGDFSFADMAVASMLQFVKPVAANYIYLGEHTTECWSEPALAREFKDLLSWRDTIYQKHRK